MLLAPDRLGLVQPAPGHQDVGDLARGDGGVAFNAGFRKKDAGFFQAFQRLVEITALVQKIRFSQKQGRLVIGGLISRTTRIIKASELEVDVAGPFPAVKCDHQQFR